LKGNGQALGQKYCLSAVLGIIIIIIVIIIIIITSSNGPLTTRYS